MKQRVLSFHNTIQLFTRPASQVNQRLTFSVCTLRGSPHVLNNIDKKILVMFLGLVPGTVVVSRETVDTLLRPFQELVTGLTYYVYSVS